MGFRAVAQRLKTDIESALQNRYFRVRKIRLTPHAVVADLFGSELVTQVLMDSPCRETLRVLLEDGFPPARCLALRPDGDPWGGSVFENRDGDLPPKPYGHYREYDVAPPCLEGRGKLRIVLGANGEVYITGNHYRDFRQVVEIPE